MFLDFSSEIYSWIRGAILILSIYHFAIYLQNKNKVYLFYSLYLISFFLYFLKEVSTTNYLPIYDYVNFALQFLGFAAYVTFARELLNSKRYIPDWDKLLVIEVKLFLIASIAFIFIQITYGYSYQEKLFLILIPIISIFSLLTYIVLTKIKGKHVTYFIVGSLSFVTLANISFLGPEALGEN